MNTSLSPSFDFELYYLAYLRSDPAREPITVNQSTPRAIADAAAKTGRPRSDFQVEEITKERFEKLKKFLR